MRALVLALTALIIASTAFAHEPRKGLNGGTVVDAGSYHVELVINDTNVDVFITDSNDKLLPSSGFKAVTLLVAGGTSQRIVLEPKEGNRLSGQASVSLSATPKGAVLLTAPDGKTAQGRFN